MCDENGANKILATPTITKGGESLTRETILKVMELINTFQDKFQDHSKCPLTFSLYAKVSFHRVIALVNQRERDLIFKI